MAARKVPIEKAWTPEKVRQRLKISMIANRLTNHVLGKVEMTSTQVTAGLGLLKKGLPDLQSVEATLQGKDGGAIEFTLLQSDIPVHPKAD